MLKTIKSVTFDFDVNVVDDEVSIHNDICKKLGIALGTKTQDLTPSEYINVCRHFNVPEPGHEITINVVEDCCIQHDIINALTNKFGFIVTDVSF